MLISALVLCLLIASGACWQHYVERASALEPILRLEVLFAAVVTAVILSAPWWNDTVDAAMHSYRASRLLTKVPAFALPVIIFPDAVVSLARMSQVSLSRTAVVGLAWLLLMTVLVLVVCL